MNSITLSIITITCNDPGGLEATLNSLKVIKDDFLSWEWVVVDSSPEINKSILSLVPPSWNVRYIQATPPKGIYNAQNLGVKTSTGKYVWILNGGDCLKNPDLLLDSSTIFKNNSNIQICSYGVEQMRNGEYLYTKVPRSLLRQNLIGTNKLYHCGIIYRRTFIERFGYFNENFKYCADYELSLKGYLAGIEGIFSQKALAQFDTSGVSNIQYKKALAESAKMKSLYRSKMKPTDIVLDYLGEKIETARVYAVKALAESPFEKILRIIWIRLNRLF